MTMNAMENKKKEDEVEEDGRKDNANPVVGRHTAKGAGKEEEEEEEE